MSEHQTTFNQRVNYGKLWFKWNRGIGGGSWVKETSRNQSDIVTVVPLYVFEQHNSPYYMSYEVDSKDLLSEEDYNKQLLNFKRLFIRKKDINLVLNIKCKL